MMKKGKMKSKKASNTGFSFMRMLGLSRESSEEKVAEERNAEFECESEEAENCVEDLASGYSVAPEKQSYSVLDDDIKIEQSHRLVSRAMKMNKFK